MRLSENIYRLRTGKNMSQGDLADVLDVSRQSVSKWETGSAVPELEKLIKMSEVFGVTIDELVNGEAPKTAENTQPHRGPVAVREILGDVILCLGIFCAIISILFGDDRTEAGIYIALLLITIGCACRWMKKLPVMLCAFGMDAIFLFVLAIYGDPASAMIFAVPFLIIFIIVMHQVSED